MISFEDWHLLKEMAELKTAIEGDHLKFYNNIKFTSSKNEITTQFADFGEDLIVRFIKSNIYRPDESDNAVVITKKAYIIEFEGKKIFEPNLEKVNDANVNKSVSIYAKLVLILNKFFNKFKPEAFIAEGHGYRQQKIYNLIYKTLFKDRFTNIDGVRQYLRNDILNAILSTENEKKRLLVKSNPELNGLKNLPYKDPPRIKGNWFSWLW